MLTKKQNLTREILTVILLLAAVAATEYWFFQLWRLDWHVPMFYGGDGPAEEVCNAYVAAMERGE